jgi:alpha-glucuronidase
MNRARLTLRLLFCTILHLSCFSVHSEDGYELWLRYRQVSDKKLLADYRSNITSWCIDFYSPTSDIIQREIRTALPALLGTPVSQSSESQTASLLITTIKSEKFRSLQLDPAFQISNAEGFVITRTKAGKKLIIVIAGVEEKGTLYGVYFFLRHLQTQKSLANLRIIEQPKIAIRILNHWDNPDRTVERGYAGISIFDWHKLPDYIDQRYHDYARANASIGINGSVLTNVNANAIVLTPAYLKKIKAIADVFRPYGIRVYLTARFNAPMEIGGLSTADPVDANVQQWWKDKVKEIYRLIPDFGGFLVKANSEGQPGPQSFNRSHAEGANLLAMALKPYNGVVMWRAFVYDNNNKTDRAAQAFNEFKPLDGKFADNVLLQVKNGPVDFQPREPFHPLFGAMKRTPVMIEFQITQEYLGFATHLVYLAPLFKETLSSDTRAQGENSTVAKVVDGTLNEQKHPGVTGIAGVANIGNDRNWCGHPFAQANWYAFGKLAWNHEVTSESIAEEWIRMTFGNNEEVVNRCLQMMMASREAVVNYMTPLGLHHIMGWDHHYGPAPWIKDKPREDWTSVYYHRADSTGLGFNRSSTGTAAVDQYAPDVRNKFDNMESCPEEFLLWFHHVSWDEKLHSGRTLWEELCFRYDSGAQTVKAFQGLWKGIEGKIDEQRFQQVASLLTIQHKEAMWWRDACLLYFQEFARKPFPQDFKKPEHDLKYYQALEFPFAPGIRPKW